MKPGQNFSHDIEGWGRSVSRHFLPEKRKWLVTMNLRGPSPSPAASHNALQHSGCSLSREPLLERSVVNSRFCHGLTVMSHWVGKENNCILIHLHFYCVDLITEWSMIPAFTAVFDFHIIAFPPSRGAF